MVSPKISKDLFATIPKVKRPALRRRLEQLVVDFAVVRHLNPCSVDVPLSVGDPAIYEHDLFFDEHRLACVVDVLLALKVNREAAEGRADVLDTRNVPPRLKPPVILDIVPLLPQVCLQGVIIFAARQLALL